MAPPSGSYQPHNANVGLNFSGNIGLPEQLAALNLNQEWPGRHKTDDNTYHIPAYSRGQEESATNEEDTSLDFVNDHLIEEKYPTREEEMEVKEEKGMLGSNFSSERLA
ncbi:hypothetical protein MMC11_006431, partial [Xylographa trunciseda]|nr:hypothetical protein [Xylographa trunciseda]